MPCPNCFLRRKNDPNGELPVRMPEDVEQRYFFINGCSYYRRRCFELQKETLPFAIITKPNMLRGNGFGTGVAL